jgi:hypothetical protein
MSQDHRGAPWKSLSRRAPWGIGTSWSATASASMAKPQPAIPITCAGCIDKKNPRRGALGGGSHFSRAVSLSAGVESLSSKS